MGQGKDVHLYARNKKGISTRSVMSFRGHTDDISRFVVRDDVLVTSGKYVHYFVLEIDFIFIFSDGRLVCWNARTGRERFSVSQRVGWNESVFMDWAGDVLAAGYNNAGVVKFLTLDDHGFQFRNQIDTHERVWSVALNMDGTSCSIGSAGYRSSPLKIYDLHR